jgi:hypothetical protein
MNPSATSPAHAAFTPGGTERRASHLIASCSNPLIGVPDERSGTTVGAVLCGPFLITSPAQHYRFFAEKGLVNGSQQC